MLADLCFDLFVDLEGTCAVWPSKSELFHQVKSCLVLSNYWRRNAEQLTVQHSSEQLLLKHANRQGEFLPDEQHLFNQL